MSAWTEALQRAAAVSERERAVRVAHGHATAHHFKHRLGEMWCALCLAWVPNTHRHER